VVWTLGEAVLAVALEVVDEVVGVDGEGLARARSGALQLTAPPGLDIPATSRQAVVVRSGEAESPARLALAADQVEGVYDSDHATLVARPGWLGRLHAPHMASLVQLHDGRLAAALDVDALFRSP
jgi:chemotaxis signal transduction protein